MKYIHCTTAWRPAWCVSSIEIPPSSSATATLWAFTAIQDSIFNKQYTVLKDFSSWIAFKFYLIILLPDANWQAKGGIRSCKTKL